MSSDPLDKARTVPPLLDSLFVLMHNAGSHGPQHPVTRKAAAACAESVTRAQVPLALQFVAGGLFRDRVLVPIDAEHYSKLAQLSAALDNLAAQEITFTKTPSTEAMMTFGGTLAQGRVGPSDALEHLRLEAIEWREIPQAQRGIAGEEVEPEVFTAAQITHAIASAEDILTSGGEPWPWSAGAGVVRRLERATATHRETHDRALELAPGTWNVARRAVCTAAHVLAMLRAVGATQATQRASAHAAFAMALSGFRDRGGRSTELAARDLLPRLMAAEVSAKSGIEPHRLRVLAIIELFAQGKQGRLGALPPIRLAYLLERMRCPPKVDFVLTRGDLMAQAVAKLANGEEAPWIRLLIQTYGALPPGTWVRLADGRIGTVLGASSTGDPARPQVLVGGLLEVPSAPVAMVPPPAALRSP